MRQLILALSLVVWAGGSASAAAEILRVCQSGCPHATVQAAFDAAQSGDVIEIEAGQVFTGNLKVPPKQGVTVRSSRWRDLPPVDERIDPVAHASLLPTLRMGSRHSPALSFGEEESVVSENGIDLVNDVLHFEYAFGLGNGVSVACSARRMPAPLALREKYYVVNWNAAAKTAQLALQPGGPPIDLFDVGSAGSNNYYLRPRCIVWDMASDWSFRGIRFESVPEPGGDIGWLVSVGSNQQGAPDMGPHNIHFDQVVISGHRDIVNGPSFCLVLGAGDGHRVRSSWIGHCKSVGAVESKGIWLQNVNGVEILNNYISAASINIMTAGGDSARDDVVRNVRVAGNFLEKPGYMMYKAGTGAPQGECYHGGGSGAFYRRTDVTPNTCENGACYTCQADSTWALDTAAQYRQDNYLTKNLLEFKDCDNCTVEGNVLRGAYVGPDGGQGNCILIAAGVGEGFGRGYHRNHNVTVRHNWCDQVYSGISATSTSATPSASFDQRPMRNIAIENNLVTNLGRFPALSQWPSTADVYVRNFYTSQGIDGLRFRHNTFRPAPGSTARNSVMIGPGHWPADPLIRGLDISNNVFQFRGNGEICAFCISSPPADSFDCSASGVFRFFPNSTDKMVRNNLFTGGDYYPYAEFTRSPQCTSRMFENNEYAAAIEAPQFVGALDGRLSASSPYSASNSSALLVSTDGRDLGVDADELEMYVLPALEGRASMPERLRVSVDAGRSQAVIRYARPGDASCKVLVYGAAARTAANLLEDTSLLARQADDREGNVVEGSLVQFLVGYNQGLLPGHDYQYRIDCGVLWVVGWFRTKDEEAILESDEITEAFSGNGQGIVEYSLSPGFESVQSLNPVPASGGKVSLRFPNLGATHYVRYRILDTEGRVRKKSGVTVKPAR